MLRVISKIRFGFCEVAKVKKPRKRRTAKIDWQQRNQQEQLLKKSQYITYMYRKDQDPSLLVLDRFQNLEPKNDKENIDKVQVDDDQILKDLEEKKEFLIDPNQQNFITDFEIELQEKTIQALGTSIPEYDSRQFRDLYEKLFSEKIFDFFSVEEFTLLLESPLFVQDVKTFPDQFFQQNQFVVYSQKFIRIALEEALQGDDTLVSKIQFADQIDQANYFENNNVINKIVSTFKGNYDQLKVLFLLHQSAYQPLLDSNTFIYLLRLLSKIEWGGAQYSKKQQQAISDLLFIKLQVQSNIPMMSFITDVFFTNLKYDSAILSVANTFLILERIYYGKNLTDLLHIFKNTFGTKRFNYYFKDSLPKVLDTFQNKTYYSNYTLQLKIYEKQNRFFIQRLGFLDSIFFASHKLRVYESAIEYQNNGFNLQSLSVDLDKIKQLEQFQNSIIEGNHNLALIELKKKFPHLQEEKDIAFRVNSQLYQIGQYILDLEQAQQSLIDRDEQYLEDFEKQLDIEAEKWLKEQQVKWDAKNANNLALQQKAEEGQVNNEQITEGSADVSSTPQAGFSTLKPKFGFSTIKPAIEIKEGNKGFLDYLRSAKNIDTEVNEKENQKIEDQIKEIDQIIKQDQKNIKQQKSEQTTYENRIHFKPVQFENKRTHKEVKITQEIKEEISDQIKSQDNKNQIKKQKIKIEQQLQDQAFIDQAKSDIAYAFDSDLNQAQQSQRLLTQLKDLKNGQYSPYFIKALIGQFGSTAAQQFSNLFFYQNNDFKHQGLELKVSYETQYGLVEKDLSSYLQGNLIQSSLGQVGYDQLLQRQQQDFKRSHFKKILSHYALYEKQLYDSTLELICKIIGDQKIPQTLTEYIYLFSKHDVKLTKDQIILVSDTLMHFKDYEVEVCQLLLNVYKKNDFIVVYSDFQNFVQKSIERAKRDLYMSFYENIKDAMLSRKQKIEQQQVEVSEKQQDQSWIQTKKELFGEFVRNMVSDLGKYNQEDCRLIMNDARLIRYNFKEIDYVNWIYANEKYPEEVEKIYNDYLKRYPEGTEFTKIIIAMQKAFQNNPNQTKVLFQDIVKQHVFSKKYQFTDSQITELTNSFRRMKEFSSFSHFLMMLMDQGYKINQNHKTLFYSVMNSADDDLQKSTIKGIVDQMILDDKDKDKAKKQTNYTTSEVFEFIPPQKEELNIYPSLDRNRKNFIGRQQFLKFGFMLEEDAEQDTQIGKPAKLGKPSNKKK